MKFVYRDRFHLYEVSVEGSTHYFLIKNSYPDPRSIKENIYIKIEEKAEEQLSALRTHYLDKILNQNGVEREIARMEVLPIGDELFKLEVQLDLPIKVLRGNDNWCIIGTSESDNSFLEEYRENIDDYGEYYSNTIENYNVTSMPSQLFNRIYDIDSKFSKYTRYDYERKQWV